MEGSGRLVPVDRTEFVVPDGQFTIGPGTPIEYLQMERTIHWFEHELLFIHHDWRIHVFTIK